MRGIVFTELLDMVEDKFGYTMVDTVIENADLPSGGVYTSVGSYPFSEMISLLTELSRQTGLGTDQLQLIYGEHLFQVFAVNYPIFFEKRPDALSFIASIENKIHPEVHKLYPDAELPRFVIEHHDASRLVMIYHSERRMSKFAEGLIIGCLSYFKESAQVISEQLTENGSKVRFTIIRNA